jgi:hypothetical protein
VPGRLLGFFDAGFQPQTRVYYIAGYVGTPDHWKVFNRKWRAFLRRNNLPHFHMTDYIAGKNRYYRDWTAAKRSAVMDRILALAVESDRFGSGRFGMAAALRLDDYERLSAEDKDLIPDLYGICLTACLSKTARLLHNYGLTTAEIDYVFEAGDRGQGRVRVALEELFAKPATRKHYSFRSLTFAGKGDFPGLQLADVLAWETGRYVPLALGEAAPRTLREPFRKLLVGNRHHGVLFDYASLSDMAERERERLTTAATIRAPRPGTPSASP